MANVIDLTGKKFKNFIVLKQSSKQKGKIYWLCECSVCHKTKEIQGSHLKGNSFKNCCDVPKLKSNSNKGNLDIGTCLICKKSFSKISGGHTRKFCFDCSPRYEKGKGRSQNISQIRRSLKKELVRYRGGKCEKCGYSKSINALQFHHKNPLEKDFTIAHNLTLSKFNIEEYYKEVDKCELLCANCHAESHDKFLN